MAIIYEFDSCRLYAKGDRHFISERVDWPIIGMANCLRRLKISSDRADSIKNLKESAFAKRVRDELQKAEEYRSINYEEIECR